MKSLNLKRPEIIFTHGIGGITYVRGQWLEMTAVPEPGAGVLNIVVCALIGWQRKRFKSTLCMRSS